MQMHDFVNSKKKKKKLNTQVINAFRTHSDTCTFLEILKILSRKIYIIMGMKPFVATMYE